MTRRNPYELLDDPDDQVEVIDAVATRRGFPGTVEDEESAAVAADWLLEQGAIDDPRDVSAQISNEDAADFLIEHFGLSKKNALFAAQIMSDYEDPEGEYWPHAIPEHPHDILDRIRKDAEREVTIERIYQFDDGTIHIGTSGGGGSTILATFLRHDDFDDFDYGALTVLAEGSIDFPSGARFYLASVYDWLDRRERLAEAARMYIKLDNMEDREGLVMITTSGPGAGRKAADDQSIAGASWEVLDEDFAHASPGDYPELLADLEDEGYDVDASEYSPPEYEMTGEHYYEGYDD